LLLIQSRLFSTPENTLATRLETKKQGLRAAESFHAAESWEGGGAAFLEL